MLLTAPNDGGAQWGPRYLLFAYVPLAILASDAAPFARRDSWTKVGRSRAKRIAAAGIVSILVMAGAWSQRAAYRTLRGTKAKYRPADRRPRNGGSGRRVDA